jgi:uncharacterized protein YbcI
MSTPAPLRGGELNAAVTSALVGIHSDYLGRGPRTASTFYRDNILITLMREVLIPAEQALTDTGRSDTVTAMRHMFQETMEADFREAVERLTGLNVIAFIVIAFISGNHLDPDIAAEIFILDQPL